MPPPKPYYKDESVTIYQGDCKESMRLMSDQSVNCCVTSPPYWGLRDYGVEGQLGLEKTPEEYVANLVSVFREVKRVLRDDGTLWLNLGDSYNGSGKGPAGSNSQLGNIVEKQAMNNKSDVAGLKPKDIVGIPWRVAFALQADGWYLRQDIIWHKPNSMPESVTDRCTKAHEYIFLLSKKAKYYYDNEAIKEKASPDKTLRDRDTTKLNNTPSRTKMGGLVKNDYETRNKRSVWTVNTKPYKGAHFATFPPKLITPCILAGCPKGGVVLDPFGGSGTVAEVSRNQGRKVVLCELNEEYIKLELKRIEQMQLNF